MSYAWSEYVPVAVRRQRAAEKVARLKKGQPITPVTIEGRKITTSVWGQAWCDNLERYSDFASRLPRGRTYVRNGSVVDLQIAKGVITAMVAGSDLYKIKIDVTPVAATRWKAICRDCAGSIDSLVELLQGHIAKGVMARVCRAEDGLFPSPREIKLSCSCPDWADMCKHAAAALYGIGARLDARPNLLFVLRGVDEKDLVAGVGDGAALNGPAPLAAKVLADEDMAALFGLDMAEVPRTEPLVRPPAGRKTAKGPAMFAKAATVKARKEPARKPETVWSTADIVAVHKKAAPTRKASALAKTKGPAVVARKVAKRLRP